MIKIIKSKEYKNMPWKNGLGTTYEVAIYPKEAQLVKCDFQWRLSSAHILNNNSFSTFNGYSRILIVWKGDGLILNDKKLLPMVPYQFSGDDKIDCSLIKDEVFDLGLIYKSTEFNASIKVYNFSANQNFVNLNLDDEVNFIFCSSCKLTVHAAPDMKNQNEIKNLNKKVNDYNFNKFYLNIMDTAQVSGKITVNLIEQSQINVMAQFILISIKKLNY